MKRNVYGFVRRHKTRLVAKGFQQQEDFYYFERFIPVFKPAIISIMLTLALSKGWSLSQIDINNAFLNRDLSKEVYMSQPPSFIQGDGPRVYFIKHCLLLALPMPNMGKQPLIHFSFSSMLMI